MVRAARLSIFPFSLFRNIFRSWIRSRDVGPNLQPQHVAEIFYLQYFYVVAYSDGSWLVACRSNDLLNLWKICLNARQNQRFVRRWRKVSVSCRIRTRWSAGIIE